MNISEVLNEEYLLEGRKYFKTSIVSEKLLKRLAKKRKQLKKSLKTEKNSEKLKQIRRDLFAINKTIPIIKEFRDYFIKLEISFIGMSEREKKKKIKNHYDEIRFIFIEKLYRTMNVVSKGSTYIIASALATLLFAIIFIPGGGPIMLMPTIHIIRNVNRAKEKVNDKKFTKDLNYLTKQLRKYQSA